MRRFFSLRRDLGIQLLALYVLFVAPVVLAALLFDQLASQRLQADVRAADLSLAQAIAQETNTILDSAMQSVRQLATYPAVINPDLQGMEETFQILMSARTDVNLIYRLDENGIMLYHYPPAPGSTIGVDFSFRDYFQRALHTQSPLISKGRISPTTQQAVATAVMPLWSPEGNFLGLVGTNIKLQSLSHTLSRITEAHKSASGEQVFILDSEGKIIAHPDPQQLLQDFGADLPQIADAVMSGQTASQIATDPSGAETLYSYVPVPTVNWSVVVSRPTAVAFATERRFHEGVLVAIAIFLVVGLLFWLALSRRVIRPLEQLAAFSQTIGLERDISTDERLSLKRLSRRSDQMGNLIRSLTRMETSITARINELSTLLQTSASVVSSLDSRTVLQRILEQLEHLLDVKMCAIVALDEQRGVFRVQASHGLSDRYAAQVTIDPEEPLSVTMRALRRSEPTQVTDTEEDPSFQFLRPRARVEGYRSMIAVPLNTQYAPPSALLVYRPEPHVYTQGEINLLTSFANHAAMAIENAALYARSDARLQEQTRRLEALIQSLENGLILEDLHGSVLYINRRLMDLCGAPPDEANNLSVEQFITLILAKAQDPEKAQAEINNALQDTEKKFATVRILENGQLHAFRLQTFQVTDSNDVPLGRGQIWQDITTDQELDRMKSSLISTVSHELRTPLAAIKGYVTTLLADDVSWDALAQQEFLQIILNETDRLSLLVNDLLDISRIEAGTLKISFTPCHLENLIELAVQQVHPSPTERLQIRLPDSMPTIQADPQRVVVVLRNLLENAVKYTSAKTAIRVWVKLNENEIITYVEDDGPGIPKEHQQRIFDSFYQVDSGLSRSAAGAGLGLAICQGIIHAHGGNIWLEKRDHGTCFAFSIPLQPLIMEQS